MSNWQIQLCDFLLTLARSEKKLEVHRQLLANVKAFEPYSAFKRIDRLQKSHINASDVHRFLAENNILFSEQTISLSFVAQHDIDGDQSMIFQEFLRAVLPQDNPVLRGEVTQRPTYDVGPAEQLPGEVERLVAKLIELDIQSYLQLEQGKQNLRGIAEFSMKRVFDALDAHKQGFVDFTSMLEFFSINDFYPYEEEIIAILRRFDRDDDGRLDQNELSLGLQPKYFSQLELNKANEVQSLSAQSYHANSTNLASSSQTPAKERSMVKQQQLSASQKQSVQISVTPPLNNYIYENVRKSNNSPLKNSALLTQSPRRIHESGVVTSSPQKVESQAEALKNISHLKSETHSRLRELEQNMNLERQSSKSPIRQTQNLQASSQSQYMSQLQQSQQMQQTQLLVGSGSKPQRQVSSPFRSSALKQSQQQQHLASQHLSPYRGLTSSILATTVTRVSPYKSPHKYSSPYRSSPYRSRASPVQAGLLHASQLQAARVSSPRRQAQLQQSMMQASQNKSSLQNQQSPSYNQNYKQQVQTVLQTLKRIILLDKETEKAKEELALRPDFNLIDFFNIFDVSRAGFFGVSSFKAVLQDLKVAPQSSQLSLFFQKFDKTNSQIIKYQQFVQIFTPLQQEYSDLLNQRKPSSADDRTSTIFDVLSLETRRLIVKVLQCLFDGEAQVEEYRQELVRTYAINLAQVFEDMDIDRDGFITLQELKFNFDKFDMYCVDKDLAYLVERFDLNKDSKISFNEFVTELSTRL